MEGYSIVLSGIMNSLESRKVENNVLSLAGVYADKVEEVSAVLSKSLSDQPGEELLRFCFTIPKTDSRTSQPRDEALWRTLIADSAEG